jgi:hypothetical protein
VNKRRQIWVATFLMFVLFALQVMSARLKSPTYDEQVYIARGYAFVKLRDLHILVGEPVLLNALNALPLLALPDVRLPVDHPSWAGTDFHPISEQFMWHVNDNADQILFISRVPTMLLTLLLAAFIYRWAREWFGPWSGLLALLLCAFDPNLIAHGRLATTDLGSTTFIFIAAYWLWRLLRRPTWRFVVAAGVFLGLAQASRFSALLFGPGFALLFLWRVWIPRPFALPCPGLRLSADARPGRQWLKRLRWLIAVGVIVLLVAYMTIWVVHGFQVGPIAGRTAFPVLAPSYFEQFFYIWGRLAGQEERQVVGFLMGELYVGGRWQYFPIAFALKTPVPTLILLVGALLLSLRRRSEMRLERLWLPPLLFFAIALNSKLNLGYRYILPVVPFVIVLAGRMGQWLADGMARSTGLRRALGVTATSIIVGWSVWSGLAIYPHYLAFFNEWAGGPDNGWRFLVDSNMDWGQDLKGLKWWMDDHGVEQIKLGYVGEGFPSYYGIDFDPLPSSPDRWEHPLHHDLYFRDPAPGLYAISANLIQGRNLADPDTYIWFREREPIDKVGYSIFIYDVPAHGKGRAVIGLSGLVPPDICLEDYARLGTNDVRVLWFDVERAMIFPGDGGEVSFFVAGDATVHPALSHLWPWKAGQETVTRDGRPLHWFEGNPAGMLTSCVEALVPVSPVWHLPAAQFMPGDPAANGEFLSLPVNWGQVELLAYEVDLGTAGETTLHPGDALTVVTYWRVREPAQEPLKLFAHLLDADGIYRGGEDRMDVWYGNWQVGDMFAQVQEIRLDADAKPGEYQMEIGWYTPRTIERFPVSQRGDVIADRVLLAPVKVE